MPDADRQAPDERRLHFNSANEIITQHPIWARMAHDEMPVDRFLLVWPSYGDHIVFDPGDLHHLPKRLAKAGAQGVFALLNLGDVERYVAERLAATA